MSFHEKDTLRALRLKTGHLQEQLDACRREVAQTRQAHADLQEGLQSVLAQLETPLPTTALSAASLHLHAGWRHRLQQLARVGQEGLAAAEQALQAQLAKAQALGVEKLKFDKLIERLEGAVAARGAAREQKQTDEMATQSFLRRRGQFTLAA